MGLVGGTHLPGDHAARAPSGTARSPTPGRAAPARPAPANRSARPAITAPHPRLATAIIAATMAAAGRCAGAGSCPGPPPRAARARRPAPRAPRAPARAPARTRASAAAWPRSDASFRHPAHHRRCRSTSVAIVRRQHADRELRQELADLEAGHGRSLSWLARRTLISAVRSRVLTVPSGMPSLSAISRAVRPPKYARASSRFSASESDARARIAASRSISDLVLVRATGPRGPRRRGPGAAG